MIREVMFILCILSLASAVIAEESEQTVNSSGIEEQMPLNITDSVVNTTSNSTISNGSALINGTITTYPNQTSEGNTPVSSDTPHRATKTEEKPVYTLSIGSVYSSDYTEPQPRTFTSSGC